MPLLILVFLTAFIISVYSTPALIKVAILKRLIDSPGDKRKIHRRSIPNIGGIVIYASTIFSFSLWFSINADNYSFENFKEFKLIIACSLVLFFVGVKDDIIGTAAVKKLFAHILVALILVLMGDIRILGLHGIFGVSEIPYWGSVFISIFTYVVVVNSFNLIDGIDGLAAGVGFISSFAFGIWFVFNNEFQYASLSFALAGALLGFLIFNFSPAKIFMGDSGSIILGMFICILSIKLIEYPINNLSPFWQKISKPVFVISIISYPLLDTFRVVLIRTLSGQSPFLADKNHIHHKLIECNYSHTKITLIIYTFSLITICSSLITFFVDSPTLSFFAVIGMCIFFLLFVLIKNKKHSINLSK